VPTSIIQLWVLGSAAPLYNTIVFIPMIIDATPVSAGRGIAEVSVLLRVAPGAAA
jgi:hypothetical protein